MAHFIRIVNSLSEWVCWISALAITVMMLLTSSDVVLRYCGYPIKGTYDSIGLLGVVVVALPIARTQLLGGHVAMGITSWFPKLFQTIIDSIACLLSFGMYGLFTWQCSVLGKKLWDASQVSDTIAIPLFPFAYVIAFGCAINCFVFLIDFYKKMKRG